MTAFIEDANSSTHAQPAVLRLNPVSGVAPSSAPPVRIFLGTEDAQYKAERIFVYSVEQVRDPARTYEIHLMKNLPGFNRRWWRTGFTNYRFAIPDFAGRRGNAIYNDVDQVYTADPALLSGVATRLSDHASAGPRRRPRPGIWCAGGCVHC